ncbi:hypothetical protein J6590_099362 [Homalodisca vitripennis]|nr:hypothetical protein J6590_099362 [Homalodisca vitripennis]
MIIAVAILIAFVATGMDFFIYQPGRNHNRSVRRWLRPFSMYKNMSKLVTPNCNSEFAEFHVYKLIAILFVISGHRQMYAIGQTPLYNVDWVEELNSYFIDVVILNGGIVVDTFSSSADFSLAIISCKSSTNTERRKRFGSAPEAGWVTLHLHQTYKDRLIAPVYMVVVGFYSYVFPHLGDGPLWTERLTQEVDRCRSNWWTNLLFINNYVNSDNQQRTLPLQYRLGISSAENQSIWNMHLIRIAFTDRCQFSITYKSLESGHIRFGTSSAENQPIWNMYLIRIAFTENQPIWNMHLIRIAFTDRCQFPITYKALESGYIRLGTSSAENQPIWNMHLIRIAFTDRCQFSITNKVLESGYIRLGTSSAENQPIWNMHLIRIAFTDRCQFSITNKVLESGYIRLGTSSVENQPMWNMHLIRIAFTDRCQCSITYKAL